MKSVAFAALLGLVLVLPAAAKPAPKAPSRHNVVIFVADGLRYSSVNPDVGPTFLAVRKAGVDFANSHAMYPTVTTANASAIGTGHYLGDTGDYGNTLWFGYPVQAKGGTQLTFFEDDGVLRDVKAHFGDEYLGDPSLLAAARAAGMSTAVVGKIGPAAILDITAMNGDGIIVDDGANYPIGLDGRPTGFVKIGDDLAKRVKDAGLSNKAPLPALPGTVNTAQQTYMTDVTVKALLPMLKDRNKPFALVYWCRDPDATQHSQEDNVGALTPGINGPTGHAAIADADTQLKRILDTLKALGLDKTTDVFVTADHGFSTISHSLPTDDGDIEPSSMPQGFVALDIAHWLGNQPLFDPDADNGRILYEENGMHPSRGSAMIGPSADQPLAIVAANGGSDLIYTPGGTDVAKKVYAGLVAAPYAGALFVRDDLLKADPAAFAGALPMSSVNLIGASHIPNPSIVLGFRTWTAKGCTLGDELCAVEIADTGLHTGQGMHGTISRADTHNFMAAMGPDFKRGFSDPTPVSNADINPTLAHILGLRIVPRGALSGRAATEALAGGKPVPFTAKVLQSEPAADGRRTILQYQEADGRHYFDAAGFPGRTVGLTAK
jgi:arylsulfatase A-like enzyme